MFWRSYSKLRFLIPYALAFALTSVAIQLALESHFKERIFRFLYPAGFFSVWFGGLGPGILSGVYGCLAFLFIAIQDSKTSYGGMTENFIDLGLYVLFGFAFGCLIDREKKSRKRITEMYQELCSVTRELSQREKALGVAIRARDDFFSIASHELKTPITALKLQVQLLERQLTQKKLENEKHSILSALNLIGDQINRLTNLIESLLDTTRIAQGSLKLELEEIDLLDLIKHILERYEGLLRTSGCVYQIKKEGTSWVKCDRFRMEQVLTNLLSNAVKYAAGQPIDIFLSSKKSHLEIIFSDHGPGIPERNLNQLFAPFSRSRDGGQNIPGLGLGLFIAKQIMLAHGGEIGCSSKLGKGTQFILKLPYNSNSSGAYAQMVFDGWEPRNLDLIHQRYEATFSD